MGRQLFVCPLSAYFLILGGECLNKTKNTGKNKFLIKLFGRFSILRYLCSNMLTSLPEEQRAQGRLFLFKAMIKTQYADTPLSVEEQIQLLKSRNLSFGSEVQARHLLQNVSLFRMKSYLYPFQSERVKHIYRDNATFEQVQELYQFDSCLRNLVFKRIEQIEVSIRTKFGEAMVAATNQFWYSDPKNFRNHHSHSDLLNSINKELQRSDDEQIVSFFQSYTNTFPPSWMAMEVSSFGTLSLLYKCINAGTCKRDIANYYGLRDTVFESWIHSLVYVRNICAHYSRLWNRNLRIQPKMPKNVSHPFVTQGVKTNRIYYVMCIIKYLLNTIEPDNNFTNQVNRLFGEYPDIDKRAMNFPVNWEMERLWM